jgi:trans-2,3-dihydro-3-hydroxyanthranilate isomerase
VAKRRYSLVDVFTNRAFGGNSLAVFTNPHGLQPATMQAIAKEMNLSETTFVLPPQDPKHDYQVRIFTPAVELPMAGHPTVGTAFVLAREHMVSLAEPETTIVFEEGVGLIEVTLSSQGGHVQSIFMRQPLPTFGPHFPDRERVAQMLSLPPDMLDASLPLEAISCGVPFLFVPVKNLEAMRAIRFRRDEWEQTLRTFEAPHLFVFTQETEHAGSTVHSRMFAPAMGIAEDPATGAASGPLGCYLVRHGLVSTAKTASIISEQGIEMGRPSFIQIKIEQDEGRITGVYIGGECHFMGEGFLELA